MSTPVEQLTPGDTSPEAGIGERIRSVRERLGLSQTQFHQRTKDHDPDAKGISRTVLIGYEAGRFKPGARELRILCRAFALAPGWLLLGTESSPKEDLEEASAMLFAGIGAPTLPDVFRLALLLATLKPHERNAIVTLAHSLSSARRSAAATEALGDLADSMALDAELRLAEITGDSDAAKNLLTFKGQKLIEHFGKLYEEAYQVHIGRIKK